MWVTCPGDIDAWSHAVRPYSPGRRQPSTTRHRRRRPRGRDVTPRPSIHYAGPRSRPGLARTAGGRIGGLLDRWPIARQLRSGDPLGLARNAYSPRTSAMHARITDAEAIPSICPYCATGCAQTIYVRDGRITSIEGDAGSPVSRGQAVPEGAGHVPAGDQQPAPGPRPSPSPGRHPVGGDRPRRGARHGRRADPGHPGPHLGGARRRGPGAEPDDGDLPDRRGDAGQRGVLPAAQAGHLAGDRDDGQPGAHLPLPQPGRARAHLGARCGHHLAARPGQRRCDPHHGLEHGRDPRGRLPVGARGQGARRHGHARRPAVHPDQRARRPLRPDPARDRRRPARRADPPRARQRPVVPGVRRGVHERAHAGQRGLRRHRGPRRAVQRVGPRARRVRPDELAVRPRA